MNSQTQAVQQKKTGKYFKGVISETKKVIWPTRKELVNYVGVVVVFCTLAAIGLWAADVVFKSAINFLI